MDESQPSSLHQLLSARLSAKRRDRQATYLRAGFEGLDYLAIYLDLDGTILTANRKAQDTLGDAPHALLGRNLGNFFAPEDRDRFVAILGALAAGQGVSSVFHGQLHGRDASAQSCWYRLYECPTPPTMARLLVFQGVTSHMEVSRAIFQHEAAYKSLLANIPDMVWTGNGNLSITQITPNVARVTGYSQEEVVAMRETWLSQVHPEDLPRVRQAASALLDAESPIDVEFRVLTKDQRWIWLHTRSQSAYLKDGTRYVNGITSDISDRKEKERLQLEQIEMLREASALKEAYRSLVESQPDVIWTADEQFRMIFVSSNISRIYGVTAEEFYQAGAAWTDCIHPEDLPRVIDSVRVLFAGEGVHDVEYRLFSPIEERYLWFHSRASTWYEKDGVRYANGISTDITDRKEKERLQREQLEALKELDTLKDEFLNMVSHELRSPLSVIVGLTDILLAGLSGPLNAAQTRDLQRIMKKSDELVVMVSNLLDVSLINAGKLALLPRKLCLHNLVQETLLNQKPLADQKGVTLTFASPSDLPAVQADLQRLSQVLTNLVNNAIKFTPVGGQVDVRVLFDAEALRVEVQDTGVGIAPQEAERIFTPFHRSASVLSRNESGAGLGLSLCRAFIEAHGGILAFSSRPGQGSTFWFTLPLARDGQIV